ncbi:MAG: NAD-dependent epimerase/dehydratase family protein [Candidatus Omnitrophota bacterium]
MENMVKMTSKFWNKRPVLVTGGDGIVGSWLIKALLQRQAKVIAFIRDHNKNSELFLSGDVKRIKVFDGKLEDFEALKKVIRLHKPDTVIHLGAQAIVGTAQLYPLETFESNIRGTYNLLEACRLNSKIVRRVVVASSDKAYGHHKSLPYTEDMSLQGHFPYEASKTCTDLLAQTYFHSYALPVAVLRCGNIFGGGDLNYSRIVPDTIKSLLMKKSPIIRSDGKFIRDYIYVKDVCIAYLLVAEHLQEKKLAGQAFNCSNEKPLTVLEIVKAITKIMKCEDIKPKILNQAFGEIRSQYLSAKKIRKVLKWQSQYDLTQGLSETIEWYREFLKKSK